MEKSKRVASVDIYRGLVMFLMMAEVWNFQKVAEYHPDSAFWGFLSFNQSHVAWAGCSLHDMIQPSFSFLVGVAMPFSISSRLKMGHAQRELWFHILKRSLILILLGVFLRSMWAEQTYWTFEDTLTQIGLGYPFLFLLSQKSFKWLWLSLAIILIGYWIAFVLYPLPSSPLFYPTVGVPLEWPHLMSGLEAYWNKNSNLAWAFDTWFLNLFPREEPFLYNSGGYATLSFIPTLGTMILGLVAGKMIKEKQTQLLNKWLKLAAILVVTALIIHFLKLNPIVKRIWTPAWTLFSGGICFLFLASFYWLIDLRGYTKGTYWLKYLGMNSIAAYVMAHTINEFIDRSFRIHIGQNYDQILGSPYATIVSGSVILCIEWLLLRWMYRKGIFIKI